MTALPVRQTAAMARRPMPVSVLQVLSFVALAALAVYVSFGGGF
jgi:hypothetical protein